MGKFIKNFGLGLLYFLALPLIILGVVCYAIYGLGVYVFYFFKGVVRFFKGDTFFEELPEDARVRDIKQKLKERVANPNPEPAPSVAPQTTNVSNQDNSQQATYNVTNNYYGTPNPMNQGMGQSNPYANPNARIDMNATEVDASYRNERLREPSFSELDMNESPMIGTQPAPQIEAIDITNEEGQ